jgi:uracil-DNA glycosylase
MVLIQGLRDRGLTVPNVDPHDGGTDAQALFLLESPGPKAVGTFFISRDNPDPSARNMGSSLDEAGFARKDVLLWNVVAQCIATETKNQNARTHQILEAAPDTQAFINKLTRLKVIVFCGEKAQRAVRHLAIPDDIEMLITFHPGAQSYNQPHLREHIHRTFRLAARLLD